MMIIYTDTLEDLRPLSVDERRAVWAAAFYGAGWHRERASLFDTEAQQDVEVPRT